MNAFVKLLYAALIAISVALFTGFTIYTFYQPPKNPYSTFYPSTTKPLGDEEINRQAEESNKRYESFREKEKIYHRNVATIVLPVAVATLALGIWYFKRNEVIGEGLALGGVADSIYALIITSGGEQRILTFLAVTVLLVGTLSLAQRRFAPVPVNTKKSKK